MLCQEPIPCCVLTEGSQGAEAGRGIVSHTHRRARVGIQKEHYLCRAGTFFIRGTGCFCGHLFGIVRLPVWKLWELSHP